MLTSANPTRVIRSVILAHPTHDPLYTPSRYANLYAVYVPSGTPSVQGKLLIISVELRTIATPTVLFDSYFQSPEDDRETFTRELNRVFSNCQNTIYSDWSINAKPTTSDA